MPVLSKILKPVYYPKIVEELYKIRSYFSFPPSNFTSFQTSPHEDTLLRQYTIDSVVLEYVTCCLYLTFITGCHSNLFAVNYRLHYYVVTV